MVAGWGGGLVAAAAVAVVAGWGGGLVAAAAVAVVAGWGGGLCFFSGGGLSLSDSELVALVAEEVVVEVEGSDITAFLFL